MLDSGVFDTICKLYGVNANADTRRRYVMTEIKWEKDFGKAVELAGKTNKQIFQDFWFDG
jgi:hypothetical protein